MKIKAPCRQLKAHGKMRVGKCKANNTKRLNKERLIESKNILENIWVLFNDLGGINSFLYRHKVF